MLHLDLNTEDPIIDDTPTMRDILYQIESNQFPFIVDFDLAMPNSLYGIF